MSSGQESVRLTRQEVPDNYLGSGSVPDRQMPLTYLELPDGEDGSDTHLPVLGIHMVVISKTLSLME